MEKVRYTKEPEPVLIQRHNGYIHVTVTANATQVAQEPEQWEADTHEFWELEHELDVQDVVRQPAAYLSYMTVATRRGAKQQAQALLDKLRNGCPVVPVPSLYEGAAVCNRASDKVMLLGGLQMGGLPYFELASGDVVSLSMEQLQGIMHDVANAEVRLQQAKQQCWADIEAAGSRADICRAIEVFEGVLAEYRSAE